MERDPEESSWIEARWLDRPGSAITIPECWTGLWYPHGGSTKAYSIQGVYITRHRIVAHLSSITRGSRPSRFGQSVWNSNRAISPYHCFALFEICKRIEGFSRGSQRSSTHEPCPLGISSICVIMKPGNVSMNEYWARGSWELSNGWNDPVQLSGCGIPSNFVIVLVVIKWYWLLAGQSFSCQRYEWIFFKIQFEHWY